jgi:hypothetical protein
MIFSLRKNPILVSRVFGGIGNQLFIYAASKRLAHRNKAELILDNITGFKYDYEYERHYQLDHFNIKSRNANLFDRLEPFSKIRRYLKRLFNKYSSYNNRSYISQESNLFDQRILDLNFKKNLYLEG